MPDFDANDDPLRLPGAGEDEPFEPAQAARRAFVPRARAARRARSAARGARPARRAAWRRCSSRSAGAPRATPARAAIARLRSPPLRRRRRLWTQCHGTPGSEADVVALRYLDVCLVLATAPFVLVGRHADRSAT